MRAHIANGQLGRLRALDQTEKCETERWASYFSVSHFSVWSLIVKRLLSIFLVTTAALFAANAAKRPQQLLFYSFNSLANPVNRRVASRLFIAIPIACVVPIMTTVFFARVSAV